MNAEAKRIRVLIVDDSASVRQSLSSIIADTPDLEVMATATDPFVAAQRIQAEIPDVIILDVEMPRMDGITFLRKLMAQRPIPCVLCSTLLEPGSNLLFEALEAGAVEVIQKPRLDTKTILGRIAHSHCRRGASRGARFAAQTLARRRDAEEADGRRHDAAAGADALAVAHDRTGGLHRRVHGRNRVAAGGAGGAAAR